MANETLGQIFKRYREQAHVTLQKAEKELKISKQILDALENGQYNRLPEDLYTKNFIKSYAEYLGLDTPRLLIKYKEECASYDKEPLDFKDQPVRSFITPRKIKVSLVVALIVLLTAYLLYQVINISNPPLLTITQPEKNLITNDSHIIIKGLSEREAQVFINEKEIMLEADGSFMASLDLKNGVNLITIEARKKHSKPSILYREILVE